MTGTASVVSCDGIFHPLCNVHSVITDTLEIFCSHKDIQTDACIRLSVIQNLGQLFLNIIEGIVHLIIIVNNLSAKLKITLYKGIDALSSAIFRILMISPVTALSSICLDRSAISAA